MKRIALTGFGILTQAGESLSSLWDLCVNKKSFFNLNKNTKNIEDSIATLEIRELNLHNHIPKKKLKYLDKQVIFTLISTFNAILNAGLEERFQQQQELRKIGVVMGNSLAQIEFGMEQMSKMVTSGSSPISPFTGLAFYFGAATGEVSVSLKTKGENATVITGANSALDCVITGANSIQRTQNEIVLFGAGENLVPDVVYGLLHRQKNISQTDYLPFDSRSTGCFFSSGSGVAVLEDKEVAKKRGGFLYAELEAYHTLTAYNCLFAYNETLVATLVKTIQYTLAKAGCDSGDIDMVIPTGDGSLDGDQFELFAIKNIFGNRKRFIYTPKPNVGHMLSVSGMIDIFIASMAIKNQVIPPMLNKVKTKIRGDSRMFVCDEPEYKKINRVLLIQRDIVGGRVGALILKRA